MQRHWSGHARKSAHVFSNTENIKGDHAVPRPRPGFGLLLAPKYALASGAAPAARVSAAGAPTIRHVARLPNGRRQHGDGHYWLSLIHISEPTRRTPISYAVFC